METEFDLISYGNYAQPRQIFVLDTNVLIHDPHAPLNFDEHQVVIPLAVLEELDGMKQGQSDRARQARQATRLLSEIIEHQDSTELLRDGFPILLPVFKGQEHSPGTLRFARPAGGHDRTARHADVKDNLILATALDISLSIKPDKQQVTLVTNDINMRVKAAAIGLVAEGYRNDSVFTDTDAMASGVWIATDPAAFWEGFDSTTTEESLVTGDGAVLDHLYAFVGGPVSEWHPGMMVSDGSGDFEGRVIDIVKGKAYVKLLDRYTNGQNIWGVRALDHLQNFAINLLLDDDIDLITLAGPAGTGKTFIALAAALKMVFDDRRYERVVITRETVAMGEEIGFLPGTEEEKMAPWCGAFIDNIEQLVGMEKGAKKEAGMEIVKSRVQMRSLGFMRGRTFSDTVLIIDEAQNLSPKQMKNLVSRAGKNTKVICLGNVSQIDTPYLSHPGSTGLASLVQKFREWRHSGHVTLQGVERSRLAAQAEEVL